VLYDAPSDERPELVSGNAGALHLAGAEEGAEMTRAQTLTGVGGFVLVSRFVGTIASHAGILCIPRSSNQHKMSAYCH
jgi:hypothetical protein